jgi:hypothetical protein
MPVLTVPLTPDGALVEILVGRIGGSKMTREGIILDLGGSLAGLAICLYYRRISRWLWASILCLCVTFWFSASRLYSVAEIGNAKYQNGYVLLFGDIFFALWWALFLTSLSLVFADVKKQLYANSLEAKIAEYDELTKSPAHIAGTAEPETTQIQTHAFAQADDPKPIHAAGQDERSKGS